MIEIKEVTNIDEKQRIMSDILQELPYLADREKSAQKYADLVSDMYFLGVFDRGGTVGFLAMKELDETFGELFAVGILEDYRRISIGRGLFNTMQNFALANGLNYLCVKLPKSYEFQTEGILGFLKAMGFLSFEDLPVENLPNLLDEENLKLILVKDLKNYNNSYKCKAPEEI